jgi:hypothetical protein
VSALLVLPAGLLLIAAGLALFSAWVALRAEKAVPPCGRFIEIDGARIHYLDQGQGPAIVMIHGLGGQLQNFSHSLLERLTGAGAILEDRPGSHYRHSPVFQDPSASDCRSGFGHRIHRAEAPDAE